MWILIICILGAGGITTQEFSNKQNCEFALAEAVKKLDGQFGYPAL